MDATTMPSIASLLARLTTDFPEITFTSAETFAWSPDERTVFYHPGEENATALLLHELSHGILNHRTYKKDVELLQMEAAAWDQAVALADTYDAAFSDDTVMQHLDSYREWLHARSSCPACGATGYQAKGSTYECVACGQSWRVNEARRCGLKRYSASPANKNNP